MQLTYGLVSITATYWLHYVARARGLYAAEGVEVAETLAGSTAGAIAAVEAGTADVSGNCPDHLVLAVERGADLAIVGGVVRCPVSAIVARPEVATIADLRGGRLGMSDSVGGVASLLRGILRRHGVAPDEYTGVAVGGTPAQVAALESGAIDAAMLTHPFEARLIARGYRLLGYTTDYWPCHAFTTLNARRDWAAAHGDALEAFLRATIHAGRWLREPAHGAEARAILATAAGLAESDVAATYQRYVEVGDVLSWEAEIDPASQQAMLDVMAEEGLVPAGMDWTKYVDDTYWRRARASVGD